MPSNVVASPVLWLCVTLALALAAPWIPPASGSAAVDPPLPPPSGGGGGSECRRWCGDVHIPYPFGIGPDDCSLPGFHLQCNDTGNGVLKLFYSAVEVVNISLLQGQMRVLNHISYSCYTAAGSKEEDRWSFHLSEQYSFSSTSNKFTAIGCRTLAYISGAGDDGVDTYQTGCVAMCGHGNLRRLSNGSCFGMGCCQRTIPRGLRHYDVSFDDGVNPSESEFNSTNPCSYAVLMEESSFAFSTAYLTPNEFIKSNHGQVPVLLDWVVGNETCRVARTKPGYACVSSDSECVDAASGFGYLCNCTKGYQGNPYVKGPYGCKDINECMDHRSYPCHGKCINKPGTYHCYCPVGTQGNASIEECQPSAFGLGARLAIGIPVGVLAAVIAFLAVVLLRHKRSLKMQVNFQQNGGQLLRHMLKVDGNNTFTIYDRRDIMKATRKFHKANIVGEGAHGTVHKAALRVGGGATAITIAVKRCKEIDESRKKEFVQELVILCHLSHPNIVRLLGCCLECEAPMLVYEFVQNRSLNHLLHGKPVRPVTLATRLRIAAETAEALAHLHTSPHPVLHGDVKPENILLADGLAAKVSDFGCSTINDNVQVVPKGTLAYLDPDFLLDFQLTEKNDVYSFGVVLVELLTRRKPQSKDGKSLTLMFQESIRGGTLGELLDVDIVEQSSMVVIQQAAELGSRCLAVPGTVRPPMEQVAQVLRRLQDQVPPERSQPPHEQELLDIGPTEMEMTTGYPTAHSQSDAAGGTYCVSNRHERIAS